MLSTRRPWFSTFVLSLIVVSGCEDASNQVPVQSSHDHGHDHSHDHDHHGPESLKDALTGLTSLRNAIRDAFAKNDQDAAHGPLHEVGEVLEAIPELAAKEKISEEKLVAIQTSVTALMDAFGRVDKTMHGQEGSTYSEESAAIDAALDAIVAASNPEAPATEATAPPTAGDQPSSEPQASPAPADSGAASDATESK